MTEEKWRNQYYIRTFLAADHQELLKFSWRTLRTMKNRMIAYGLRERFKDRYEDLLLAIDEKQNYREPTPGIIQLIVSFFSNDKKAKPENKKERQPTSKAQKYWESDDKEDPLLPKQNKE